MSDFIAEAIVAAQLDFDCQPLANDYFCCRLQGPQQQMERKVRVQAVGEQPPTLGQFLYFYAQQTQGVHIADDFEDWADDEDYSPDDPKAKAIYLVLQQDVDDLSAVMGIEHYETMMAGLEIHQAFSRARTMSMTLA